MKQFKTVKEAEEFVGGLSKPSKMPCYSYGLSAKLCNVGSRLAEVVGSTCADCYALKGFYGDWNKNLHNAHAKRREAIDKPEWVNAMVFLINKKGMEYFRWHDSGDIQHLQHLMSIVAIAEQCPNTKFWMPTRERETVSRYKKAFGDFPANLTVRVSASMVDDKTNGECTSTVHQDKPAIGFECRAPKQEGKCGNCRACWDKSVVNVSYKKH